MASTEYRAGVEAERKRIADKLEDFAALAEASRGREVSEFKVLRTNIENPHSWSDLEILCEEYPGHVATSLRELARFIREGV